MRFSLATLAMMAPIAVWSQSAPSALPEMPKAPAEIFAAAEPLYDLTSATTKPWHMLVNYQLYDADSKPTVAGTYEYWFGSPEIYRSTWKRPGMEQTDWHNGGQNLHLAEGEPLSFFERKLKFYLLNPVPGAKSLDAERVRFQEEAETIGGVKVPCIMVIRKMPDEHAQIVPMGMFPTYCFDAQQPMLRTFYGFGSASVVYNAIVRTQGKFLARKFAIFEGKRRVLDATVDVIDGTITAESRELYPPDNAIVVPSHPHVAVSSGVAQGMLLKQVPPSYPPNAMHAHVSGTVVLQATIGTDGRVHDLHVVSGPHPSLVGAAMVAVSQWQYKPYVLNGEPIEVDTTVNVVFNIR